MHVRHSFDHYDASLVEAPYIVRYIIFYAFFDLLTQCVILLSMYTVYKFSGVVFFLFFASFSRVKILNLTPPVPFSWFFLSFFFFVQLCSFIHFFYLRRMHTAYAMHVYIALQIEQDY